MMKKLVIIGASGHGTVVADIAIALNRWRSIAFLDDDDSIKAHLGLEVIGKTADALKFRDEADFIVAIGNNATREMILEQLVDEGVNIITLIHPSAVIENNVEIGMGTVVMAGVVINSSTRVGKGCIVNTSSSIDHDNIIEEFVHISPGVRTAGNVTIGKGTWLGIGSVVSNNIKICSGCKFGAGSVVIKDITESGTYVGVPVRRVNR